MHRFIEKLKVYSNQLMILIKKLKQRLENKPDGALYIKRQNGSIEYYHQTQNRDCSKNTSSICRKREYIPRERMEEVRALAQKSYDEKLLKAAQKQYDAAERFLKDYDPDALKKVYEELSPERRALVKGVVLDDRTYAERWQAFRYPPGEFDPAAPEFYTKKNERVRSKSEVIIADMLREKCAPYRYEQPHEIIEGEKPWRPDFTVLNVKERREILFEHFGRMDDPEYVRKSLWKLSQYIRQGYFPGENLVFTMESKDQPLSTKDLELLIQKYFL